MYFISVFILGIIVTFISIKFKSKWAKWVPSYIFLMASLFMGMKILFFPAAEMAVLGEIVYFMIFGTLTIAAGLGGMIIHFWKRNRQ
jgi:hypothetical protein